MRDTYVNKIKEKGLIDDALVQNKVICFSTSEAVGYTSFIESCSKKEQVLNNYYFNNAVTIILSQLSDFQKVLIDIIGKIEDLYGVQKIVKASKKLLSNVSVSVPFLSVNLKQEDKLMYSSNHTNKYTENIIKTLKKIAKKNNIILFASIEDGLSDENLTLLWQMANIDKVYIVLGVKDNKNLVEKITNKLNTKSILVNNATFSKPDITLVQELFKEFRGEVLEKSEAESILAITNNNIHKIIKILLGKQHDHKIDNITKKIIACTGILDCPLKVDNVFEILSVDKTLVVENLKEKIILTVEGSFFFDILNDEISLNSQGKKLFDSMDSIDKMSVLVCIIDYYCDMENFNTANLELKKKIFSITSEANYSEMTLMANNIIIQQINVGVNIDDNIFRYTNFDDNQVYSMLYYFIKMEYKKSLTYLKSLKVDDKTLKECLIAILTNRQGNFEVANSLFSNIKLSDITNPDLLTITLAYYINNLVNLDNIKESQLLFEKYKVKCSESDRYYPFLIRVYTSTLSVNDSIIELNYTSENTTNKYEKALLKAELAKKLCIKGELNKSLNIFNENYTELKEYDSSNMFILCNNYAIGLIYQGDYKRAIEVLNPYRHYANTDLQKIAVEINLLIARMLMNKNIITREIENIEGRLVLDSKHNRVKQQFYINALFIYKYITGKTSKQYLERVKEFPDRYGESLTNSYIAHINDMDPSDLESVLKAYKPIYLAYWSTNSIKFLFNKII